MNMTKEQVQVAVAAGLSLTNPESELLIPVKHAGGVVILHQLLLGIASGQVRLTAPESGELPGERAGSDAASARKMARKTARKTARKKTPKKKPTRKRKK